MRVPALLLSLAFLPLAGTASAQPTYDRPVHIITSDYDQLDTTYIDRGRLDGVQVGNHFQVQFPDGKVVTNVVVTAVFERMSAVKIVDSWFLKNGQIAGYNQRPMVVPLEPISRRTTPASWAARHRRRHRHGVGPAAAPASARASSPAVPAAPAAPAAPALGSQASTTGAPASAALPAPGAPQASGSSGSSGASALPAPGAPDASGNALPPPPDAGASDANLPAPSDSAPAPAGAPAGGSDANIPPPPE